MPNCKQHEICGLSDRAEPKAGLCILHSRDTTKDKAAFATALDAHCQRSKDFRFFVFPVEADFQTTKFAEKADFGNA